MDLKGLLSKLPLVGTKAAPSEVYFALLIGSEKISAAIWSLEGRNLKIINTAETKLDNAKLLESANNALDECLADFPYDPTKVLFGVPETWLTDGNLKPEYLEKLRVLTKELSLSPMAFVSNSHAISHFLQTQTGAPLTAVLVENSDPLVLTIVKSGKVVITKEIKRGESLNQDIEKGLLMIDEVEVLPSRIIAYGEKSQDGLKDRLVSFPWMSKLPFLHLPKIDVLDQTVPMIAVCFAGAFEINPDVSYVADVRKKAAGAGVSALPVVANDGFVEGDIEADSFGQDQTLRGGVARIDRELASDEFDDELEVGGSFGAEQGAKAKGLLMLKKIKRMFKVPTRGGNRKLLLFASPIALVLILMIIWVVMVKVDVQMFIDAKTLDRQAKVEADPAISAPDDVNRKIPGKVVSVSVNDTLRGTASGQKQIGDPAKGKVIIYNKTDSSKSLASGTVLSSDNGLKFTLDSSVNIASQSATPGPDQTTIIKPGKSDAVGVTATVVGPEGNLAAGVNLSINGFTQNQMLATIDSALSGGTSKTVTVVSSDDHKKLLADLASNLRKKARDEIQAKLDGDMKVSEEGLIENITRQTYSKKVGDQASDFTLTLSVDYKGTAYSDSDFKTMAAKSIDTSLPEGYELNLAESETQATATKVEKDGRLIFDVTFRAKLSPKLDKEQIKKQITGKSVGEATDVLKQIENVIGVVYEFSPSFTKVFGRLPFWPGNINITVVTK
jgi:hypothetical protein